MHVQRHIAITSNEIFSRLARDFKVATVYKYETIDNYNIFKAEVRKL